LEDTLTPTWSGSFKHGDRVFDFFRNCKLKYPFSLHFHRATPRRFAFLREAGGGGEVKELTGEASERFIRLG